MLFLGVLAAATAIAKLVSWRGPWSRHARWGMATAMVVAGLAHLLRPEPFLQHIPPLVPFPEFIVASSGVVEIGLGVFLLGRQPARSWAGRALAVYLVAVFPANVYVAVAGVDVTGQPGGIYPWVRLPLQALFVAWALWIGRPRQQDPKSSSEVSRHTATRNKEQPDVI